MSSSMMAATLVQTLIASGITDAVLAPGSRNAALSIALDRAAREGKIRLHVRVDERSAGFLALGLAKASGRPAPLVCTSGTAVGNLLPAAMEARHAGVPWLALTCDRPAFRVGSGASQTTDQPGIFGAFAVANVRLSSSSGRPAHWAAGLRRGLAAALGTRTGRPGPAQLNVEFSEPLLGGSEAPEAEPPAAVMPPRRPAPVHLIGDGQRSVVVAGDAAPEVGGAGAGLRRGRRPAAAGRTLQQCPRRRQRHRDLPVAARGAAGSRDREGDHLRTPHAVPAGRCVAVGTLDPPHCRRRARGLARCGFQRLGGLR